VTSPDEYPDERPDALAGILSPEEPYYDPEVVADTALWPVVDKLWRGDWRRDAYPGLNFQFPRRAQWEGSMVDVYLVAGCELSLDGDDEVDKVVDPEQFTSCVTVMIETTAEGDVRDYMLTQAYDSWRDIQSAAADHYERTALVAKSCIEYAFSTDGDMYIKTSQDVVRLSDGDIAWTNEYDEGESEDTDQMKLHAEDLDRLGTALMTLTDSPEYIDVMDAIKKNPILPD
jgi:hypothetical protein